MGKRHFVSHGYDPQKLGAYFERRAEHRERLQLLEIDVAHDPERSDIAHIAYSLERTADDLGKAFEAQPIAQGKGAIDCPTGTIAVWSMGHDTRLRGEFSLCSGEPDPPRIALACVRRLR